MTPQELKNSILQLAIQGKLVEQRPEEGTGEELYRQIPNPEIGDETPFDIPETWRWSRLDNLASKEIRRGKSPKYDDTGSAYAFAQKCNSKYDGIQLGLALKISDASLSRYTEDDELKDGDIVINSTGTGTLGRIGLFKDRFNVLKAKYYPDSHVTIVRAKENVVIKYLYYCLNYYRPFLESMGEGSTNQKELKPATVKNLLIPLPPIVEQHRIVAKIEELLPLIDRYGAAWNRLEDFNKRFPTDMQKSLLQMAIQGKLVEQRPEEGTGEELYQQIQAEKQALIKAGKIKKDKPLPEITEDEIPFDIPEGWKWVRLPDIAFIFKRLCIGFAFSAQLIRTFINICSGIMQMAEC
jgi:type I restriction enzyme S subunit